MASILQKTDHILRKGDVIINPKTLRPIRVGGRTWLQLVKEGLIDGHYRDNRTLAESKEDPEDVDQQIEDINKTLPKGKHAVRGRGQYKGKIVTRKNRINEVDQAKLTAQAASKVVNENIDELIAAGDDFSETLEELILREMMGNVQIAEEVEEEQDECRSPLPSPLKLRRANVVKSPRIAEGNIPKFLRNTTDGCTGLPNREAVNSSIWKVTESQYEDESSDEE